MFDFRLEHLNPAALRSKFLEEQTNRRSSQTSAHLSRKSTHPSHLKQLNLRPEKPSSQTSFKRVAPKCSLLNIFILLMNFRTSRPFRLTSPLDNRSYQQFTCFNHEQNDRPLRALLPVQTSCTLVREISSDRLDQQSVRLHRRQIFRLPVQGMPRRPFY